MQITIKNYRGCATADLTLNNIALVAGRNHSGKSSIAQAVAAALTQNPAPVDGVNKSGARQLLRDGEKRGSAKITTDAGSVTVNWPGGSVSTDDTPPHASAMACGLTSLVDMKPAQAATTLVEILRALPTRDDLQAALPDTDAAVINAIWQKIESEGWDAAHKRAIQRGQEYKGAWEHVTGERWGAQKAADWQAGGGHPDAPEGGWAALVERLTAEIESAVAHNATAESVARQRAELEAAAQGPTEAPDVAAIESELETAISNRAGDQGQRERLERIVADGESVDLAAATERCENADAALASTQAELDALPAHVDTVAPVPCPHCGEGMEIVSRTEVRPAAAVDVEEKERRAEAIKEVSGRLEVARNEWREANAERDRLAGLIEAADRARAELADMPAGTVTDDQISDIRARLIAARSAESAALAAQQAREKLASLPDSEPVDIQPLRDQLSEAELAAHDEKRAGQAAGYHQKILDNQRLVDELAPTGLRQRRLAELLDALNADMRARCEAAGWAAVAVDSDLSATLAGRPYGLLSESEKYRVRVILQLALCQQDEPLVIDAADVLDRDGRNGLFRMLLKSGRRALVCMTIDTPDAVPDLSKSGSGQSYWMDGAELVDVARIIAQ